MILDAETIKAYVKTNRLLGRSKQWIEDEFKLMLRQKLITVDDYCTAMEIIYPDKAK